MWLTFFCGTLYRLFQIDGHGLTCAYVYLVITSAKNMYECKFKG